MSAPAGANISAVNLFREVSADHRLRRPSMMKRSAPQRSLPPCGGGTGWGESRTSNIGVPPTPSPSPQGEGNPLVSFQPIIGSDWRYAIAHRAAALDLSWLGGASSTLRAFTTPSSTIIE